MSAKQDRQGVRRASELEQKYNLGADYNEIKNVAISARDTATEAMSKATNAKETADAAEDAVFELSEVVEQNATDIDGLDGRVEALEKAADESVEFTTDATLTLKDGVLSVNTAKDVEADNTLPVTSAAVYTEIGNIDVLLQTI